MTDDCTDVNIDMYHPLRDRCAFCDEEGHERVRTTDVRIAIPSDLLEQAVRRCCPPCASVVRLRGERDPRRCVICRKPGLVTPHRHAVFEDADALMCESCHSALCRGEASLFNPPD